MEAPATMWKHFEDLFHDEDDNAIPLFGYRILVFSDDNGSEWFKWRVEGDPTLSDSVAMLERVKFILQIKEFDGEESA